MRDAWTLDVDHIVTGSSFFCHNEGLLLTKLLLATEELLNLHRGQGLELLWRDSLQCPTEEEYIDVVDNSELPGFYLLPGRTHV